jgi:hypothetical protein
MKTAGWSRPDVWVVAAYGAAVAFVTITKGLHHPGNFLLFRCVAGRLAAGQDLYLATPDCSGFLYSPTFAALFTPIAWLPALAGLLVWNALNAGVLYVAVRRLLPAGAARFVLWFVFLDVVRSLQNSQSNALMAGLLVATFVALEGRWPLAAGLATGIGAFTKIFPLAGGVLALPHPGRGRALLGFAIAFAGLATLPLAFTTPALLAQQYRWWFATTAQTAVLHGASVMGILQSWFGAPWPNWPVQLAGTLALLAPLAVQRRHWSDVRLRVRFLASLLVYLVVFNHQAESASYVIATTGVGIWVATAPRARWRDALAAMVFLIVSVAATSAVPFAFRHDVIRAYALQAVPCVICWIVMQRELWTFDAARAP